MTGHRKFCLGLVYLLGSLGLLGLALWRGADAGVIAATSAGLVSVAPGIAAVIWGNVQEHRARNGHDDA